MPPISDLLNTTVAQAIAWIVSTGIFALVTYALTWFPGIGENARKIAYAVLSAALIGGVTAFSQFIPEQYLSAKIIDAVVALVATLASLYSAKKYSEMKAICHMDELQDSVDSLQFTLSQQTKAD